MSKRCTALWQLPHKAKGATTRCNEQATRLVVFPSVLERMCAECADKWVELRFTQPDLQVLGVLVAHDRANPEVIRALRVRHVLAQRSAKR